VAQGVDLEIKPHYCKKKKKKPCDNTGMKMRTEFLTRNSLLLFFPSVNDIAGFPWSALIWEDFSPLILHYRTY
jgi:hypothetical protein